MSKAVRPPFKDCAARITQMRDRIAEMHAKGWNRAEMADALGVSSGRAGIAYHCRILGLPAIGRGGAAKRNRRTE